MIGDLPDPIISLIQYSELNESGWYERTKEKCILGILWLSKDPCSFIKIIQNLKDQLSLHLGRNETQLCMDRLVNGGHVIRLPSNYFKLSESTKEELNKKFEEANILSKYVQDQFCVLLQKAYPTENPNNLWKIFHDNIFIPMIKDAGARIYEIMLSASGANLDFTKVDIDAFLARIPERYSQAVRAAIIQFMNPNDDKIRHYFLMYLEAYFSAVSSGISENAHKKLQEILKTKLEFVIFVDTNFVFSLLGLHENPHNLSTLDLMDLVAELNSTVSNVSLQFAVHPITIQEARQTIHYKRESLGNRVYPANLARASIQSGRIGGIELSFMQKAADSPQGINPYLYLGVYESNLEDLLKSKGIQIVEGKPTKQILDYPEVTEDIENQIEYENKNYKTRAKGKNQIINDVLLWYVVRDMRDPHVIKNFESKYWIVTVDHHFLGYDRYKSKNGDCSICLFPDQITQILRLYIPRSERLEKVIVDNMRLPFGLMDYDAQLEQVSVRIIKRMVEFKNIDLVPDEVLTKTINDDVLRGYLGENRLLLDSEEEKVVESSLLKNINEYAQNLELYKEAIKNKEAEASALRDENANLTEKLQTVVDEQNNEKLKSQEITAKLELLENQIREQKEQKELEEKEELQIKKRKMEHRNFLFSSLILIVPYIIILSIFWRWVLPSLHPIIGPLGMMIFTLIIAFFVTWLLVGLGKKTEFLSEEKWFRNISEKITWKGIIPVILAILWVLISGVLQEMAGRLLPPIINAP